MGEAFKEFQTAPTLVFDEMPEMNEKAELAETAAKEPEPMDDSVLSDEERAMVDSFSPVSYTHLDVYKRQGNRFRGAGSLRFLRPA